MAYIEPRQQSTGTDNSILIAKTHIEVANSLSDFVNDNINTLKQNTETYKQLKSQTIFFDCNGQELEWNLQSFMMIQWNGISKNLYLWQYFFIRHEKWYILSIASPHKDIHDMFISSLDNIECSS